MNKKQKTNLLIFLLLLFAASAVLGPIANERYKAYQIDKLIQSDGMVLLETVSQGGNDSEEITLLVSLRESDGTFIKFLRFEIDGLHVGEVCTITPSDLKMLENAHSSDYIGIPGYWDGQHASYEGDLFVNYTEIVEFTLRGDSVSLEVVEDVYRYPIGDNPETPTVLAVLCDKD